MNTLEAVRNFFSIKRNEDRNWRKGCLLDSSVVKEATCDKKKKESLLNHTGIPYPRGIWPLEKHTYIFFTASGNRYCQTSPWMEVPLICVYVLLTHYKECKDERLCSDCHTDQRRTEARSCHDCFGWFLPSYFDQTARSLIWQNKNTIEKFLSVLSAGYELWTGMQMSC